MRTRVSKKIVSIMLTMVMMFMVCINVNSVPASAASAGFHVSGTKLYDANGNEFIMRGANYPHAWYTSEYTTAIPAIASKGFNSVRIVLSNGQKYDKTSYSEVSALIDICKQNNLVAILEVHDATGSDSTDALNQAVNYWIEMKSLLQGNEAYVILNIANEWYGTWDDGNAWKNGNISAIKSLRNAGINNTIMVDCAGWGQYPQVIFDHGKEVLNADSQGNTMFSIHMYEYAGGDATTVRNNIDSALNQNLCLVIGEFGGYHTNGDVDEQTIMDYCQEKGVGWLAWSWTGNDESLNYLDMCYDFAGNSLTSFGNQVIYGTNGISQTAKTCSIFSGYDYDDDDYDDDYDDDNDGSDTSTNIFYGSSYADNWAQAVSVSTTHYGGSVDVTGMSDGDYIWVEYTGAYGDYDLVFESFSGGNSWAKISPSENGSTDNGTYYSKFYYNDIVNVYGSDFSTVDKVHISSHVSGITVKSVDIVTNGSGSSDDYVDSDDSNNDGSDDADDSDSNDETTTNIFYGNSYASNWSQAVSISTTNYGGSVNVKDMSDGDYFWVEYTGSYGDFDLVFESFSGGNSWARISPSENGGTGNGTYYAKFYYSDIANVYGSNFSTVDRIHISAHTNGITVKSVDLVK